MLLQLVLSIVTMHLLEYLQLEGPDQTAINPASSHVLATCPCLIRVPLDNRHGHNVVFVSCVSVELHQTCKYLGEVVGSVVFLTSCRCGGVEGWLGGGVEGWLGSGWGRKWGI